MKSHYAYDRALVRAQDGKVLEQGDGFEVFYEFGLIPLAKIKPERVWRPDRLQRVMEAINAGKALPPIHLVPGRSLLEIDDGIHRYNASLQSGFTHIPALIQRTREVEILSPSTPTAYKVGDYVRFREPFDGRWEYGYLAGNPYGDVFDVVGGDSRDSDWLGDLPVEYFAGKETPPAPVVARIQSNWYLEPDDRVAALKRAHRIAEQYRKRGG